MSTYTPDEIETMARTFVSAQVDALTAACLSDRAEAEVFEAILDQLADNMRATEAEWDLFAANCRLQFYGTGATTNDRIRWRQLAGSSRAAINLDRAAEAVYDAADHANDLAREVAA